MVTGLAAALLALASSEPFVKVVHREMNLEADVGAAFATPPDAHSRRARAQLGTEALGLQMGVMALLARGSSSALMSMGFDGRLEGDRYFVEIAAGIHLPMVFGSSDGTSTLHIWGVHVSAGAAYILTATNVAPYVGFGIEGRLNLGSDGGPAGLVPYVQVGLLFTRRAPVGLYLEFRVGQHVVPSKVINSFVFPTEVGGALGIGW